MQPCSCVESFQHFQVRLDHPANAADIGRGCEFIESEFLGVPYLTQSFDRDIEAKAVSVFETIDDGLGGRISPDCATWKGVLLYPIFK